MTITTKQEYEQKKRSFQEQHMIFSGVYSHFINMPCAIYDSNSKGVNQQCLDSIWKQQNGPMCDKPSPYTTANQANKTYGQIIKDTFNLAKEKPGDCYTDSNRKFYMDTPSVANINYMVTYTGKSFAKNNNPILNMGSEDMCASNCTSQSNCVSATYNSDSKKCWLNIGTYADWKPPVDGSANDVAFVNQLYKGLYELETLNNELHEYEVKNNISKTTVFPSKGNLNKFLNDIPGKAYKFLTNKEVPNSGGGTNSTCDASTCSAAGEGGCEAPCGWNENNYCVCGGTGGKAPATEDPATEDIADEEPKSFDDIFEDDSVDPKEVDLLKKQFSDLNSDRIATAKLLKKYKQTITDIQMKQENTNEALKKQIITMILISVVGILLILLLSAIMQSFRSNSSGMSGGSSTVRTFSSTARTFWTSLVKTISGKK